MKKIVYMYIAILIIVVMSLSGCSDSDNMENVDESAVSEYDQSAVSESQIDENINSDEAIEIVDTKKLIRTVNMTIETNKFNESLEQINIMLSNTGGYIENSQVLGNSYGSKDDRSSYFVFRIPNEKLSSFLEKTTDLGNVVDKLENVQDVTSEYTDTKARLTSLKIEFERLVVLIGKAEKLDDIIKLEKRLSEVRYKVDSLTSQLKLIDKEVDFSTVSMEIYEVKSFTTYQESNMAQRISAGFSESLLNLYIIMQNIIVVTVSFVPYLFMIGLIYILVYFIYRKISMKISRKKSINWGDRNE